MMRFARALATAFVALSVAAGTAAAQSNAASNDTIVLAQAKKSSSGPRHLGTQVYLLRGFMDVFSTGMNDLGTKMSRQGIRASVHNHGEYLGLANAIGERHRQGIRENVVIIGHSLGANDAFRMAERLDDFKINVPLIITFDPTATMSAGRNISRVVNFYSSTNGWGTSIARGPGFRGSLSNIDLSRRGEIGHTDIDKSPALHSQSIGYVRSIGGSRSSTATAAPKAEPADKESSVKSEEKTAATDASAAAPASTSASTGTSPAKPAGESTETAASKPAAPASTSASTDSSPAKPAGESTATAASKPAAPASSN